MLSSERSLMDAAAAVECPERLLSPAFVADLARMVRAVVWG